MSKVTETTNHKHAMIAMLIISFAISIFSASLYHIIVPYHTIDNLKVKILEKGNESSYGHNVRIRSIKRADGSYVDLENEVSRNGWQYGVDENVLGYYEKGESEISIPVDTNTAVLSMIKQKGSGVIEIFTNDRYYTTIDLYTPKWMNTTEVVHGSPNILGVVVAFSVSFIAVMSTLIFLFYHIYIKKNVTTGDLTPGILVAVSLGGLICIYAPLELYFTNTEDFWYDFTLLLPAAVELFLACVLLVLLLFSVAISINVKIYKIAVLVGFTILIAIYIQGNFLVGQLPPMDGTTINWENFTRNNLITVAAVLFVGIVVGITAWKVSERKVYNAVSFISGGLFLMLMCTISALCISNDGLARKSNMKATTNNEYVMSTEQNFIILLFDAVDSRTFWKVLEEAPEYKEVFDDFTYYPDTLGTYSFTSRSIPFILSGQWFENKEPFERYQTKALRRSPLFNHLEERQYTLGIYDQGFNMNLDVGLERFDNQVEIKQQTTSWKDFLLTYLSMGGVKYAPYSIKQYCYELINQRENLLFETEDMDGGENYGWENTDFFQNLKEKDFELADNNIFKFIHLEGAHVPYQYNANLEKIENATYETNIEACITLMKTYLNSLKESGLYSNSTIIFMSDHGYWGEDIYNPDDVLEIRQNPMLLIKGFDEKHDFQVSKMSISYDDLQSAYFSLLDGKKGEEIFNVNEGEGRERRYLFYQYLEENTMEEYIQTGDVWQPGLIHPTGREFNQ